MNPVYVVGLGYAAPGMASWQDAQAVLTGHTDYQPQPLPEFSPSLLPANERRRATPVCRLAFRSAEQALAAAPIAADRLASVFATSGGDTTVLHRVMTALTTPSRAISPTDFHNSVHNAPAGYWAIATAAKAASTSIGGHDFSFAAGLLEAVCLAQSGTPVLLVCYDLPYPEPLQSKRPISAPASVALMLTTEVHAHAPHFYIQIGASGDPETTMTHPLLEVARRDNPAARALPLLAAMALAQPQTLVFTLGGTQLQVHVTP